MESVTYEGVVYTYKPEHGAWFEDREHESVGTLHAPAYRDGGFAAADVGEIEYSYYEAAGVCDAACELCLTNERESA